MSSLVNYVLNRNPPYMDIEVPYERTKAEIEILYVGGLNPFRFRNAPRSTLSVQTATREAFTSSQLKMISSSVRK